VKNTALLKREPVFIRALVERIQAAVSTGNKREIRRQAENRVSADGGPVFRAGFFRNVINTINILGGVKFPVFVSRLIHERLNGADAAGYRGDYLRGLYIEAGNIAGTKHEGNTTGR
jgi:hypothetical protein